MARGIDVEALGHVINFDVPVDPDSYIHRVGRTARAELKGDAFTFVSPDEESDLHAIERALGKPLLRVTLPGFDYAKRTEERLEIPLRERLAAHRAARRGNRPPAGKGGGKPGGGSTTQPPHASGRGRGHGRRLGHDARLQAILDRHAPLAESSRSQTVPATGLRRRGRR